MYGREKKLSKQKAQKQTEENKIINIKKKEKERTKTKRYLATFLNRRRKKKERKKLEQNKLIIE